MALRRIYITGARLDGKPIAEWDGISDEQGESELYYPYGIVSGRKGMGVLVEIQDDPDNHLALAPEGDREAFDATVIYWGDNTQIELTDERIELTLGGAFFRLEAGKITTNLTIETSGDVIADGISLKGHKHPGVQSGGSQTGAPV